VTSLVFAGSAVGLFGAVAIATEASTWYVAQRNAQAAADAAALAAAANMPGGESVARPSAISAATRNGFTAGTGGAGVTVTFPSGFSTSTLRAQAEISQLQPRGLASFFIPPPTVRARAAAVLEAQRDVCMVSQGPITVAGSVNVTATNCSIATNSRSSAAIDISGNPTLNATSISAPGLCSGCTTGTPPVLKSSIMGGDASKLRELDFVTPIPAAFTALDSLNLPTSSGGGGATCSNSFANVTTTTGEGRDRVTVTRTVGSGWEECRSLITSWPNSDVQLRPGTYFVNTPVRLSSRNVSCLDCTGGRGVTLVFLGNNDMTVTGNSSVTLRAPSAAPVSSGGTTSWWGDGALRGVLVYRRDNGTTRTFDFSGNSGSSSLTGGIYLPGATMDLTGSSGSAGCAIWVAGSISLRGNPSVTTSQCAEYGNIVPSTQRLRLVQPI
jgi:hypothetical protein